MNTRNDGELFSLYNFFRVITLFAFLLSASSTVTAKFGDMVADLNVTAEKFAVDSTRNRIYVSVSSANQVAVIDVNSLSIISQINVSPSPTGLSISPDGSSLYVTSTVLPELAIIDLNTFIPYDYIPLPSPGYDVVAGNGDQVFVTPATQGPGIMNLDVASRITTEFNAGIFIYKNGLLEISPDRNTLYFANSGISPGTLARFDVSMPAPILLTSNPHAALGSNGKDLTLTADGMFVSYAVGGGNTQYDIHKLQSNDFSLVGSFLTGPYPNEITYSADGSLAFTVHTAGQIDIFDAYTFIEQQPITVTGEAHELIVDSSGRYLFAAFADSLRVYSVLDAVTPLPWLPDPGLQACLEEQVIQNQWQFAEEVTTFHCISHGVQDLAGMDIFSRLKVLDLSDNQISIISPLSSISGLQSLNISQNNISDLMPLDPLRQLSDLDVSANNLTSLNGLTGNTQLTRLVLSGNPNLSMSEVMMVLDNNPGLTHLGLADLSLADLDMLPLIDETTGQPYKLVDLDISNTGIDNITRLNGLPASEVLALRSLMISDISPLFNLPSLYSVDLFDSNQLQCSDLDALENKLGPDAVNRPLSCIMDNPPVITMYEPVNGVQVEADGLLTLSATASDVEDGNLDSLIQWTSNLDGVLGNGGSLSVTLSVGQHLITASVVDSSGQNAFVTVNVEVAATSVAYCPSSGTSTSYEWINGVVFNGIPNITGNNNGYGDYTSMVFNLQAGINYPLQLTPGFRYGSYNEYWSVWIDFDQNGIFDTSERVFYGSSRASINSVITIPAGANTGITRMRVGMRYGGTPSACGNFTWGEVEDYNINILN